MVSTFSKKTVKEGLFIPEDVDEDDDVDVVDEDDI